VHLLTQWQTLRNLANVVAIGVARVVEELSVGVAFDVEARLVVVRFTAVVVAIGGAVSVQPVGHAVFRRRLLVQSNVVLIAGARRPAVDNRTVVDNRLHPPAVLNPRRLRRFYRATLC